MGTIRLYMSKRTIRMSYDIEFRDASFFIPAKKKTEALSAINNLVGEIWVQYSRVRGTSDEWDSLTTAMADWRFPVETDEDGNVVDIKFTGEKAGETKKFFDAIAPFVKENSYIELMGANGEIWRLVFKDNMCIRRDGEVTFN